MLKIEFFSWLDILTVGEMILSQDPLSSGEVLGGFCLSKVNCVCVPDMF